MASNGEALIGVEAYENTAAWLQERLPAAPEVAMVLGSGLGAMADDAEDRLVIDYGDIPNFPQSTVTGHAGKLVYGVMGGKRVLAMQGRFHHYEGWSMSQATFPVRIFKLLGVDTLMVTNSAGGINPDFAPGDLMLIRDHLNMTGVNPLRGVNIDRFGVRFPDMSEPYDRQLRLLAMQAAQQLDLYLHTGIYGGVHGPSYETPAEIRMLRRLGADAVGMSTVPEVLVARHAELRVLGISCITNMAAGLSETRLTHEEVKEVAYRTRERFVRLVRQILELMD